MTTHNSQRHSRETIEALRLETVNTSELLNVLLQHLKRARWVSDSVQRFGGDDDYVDISFDREGLVENISSGLKKSSLAELSVLIDTVLLSNQTEVVGQSLCFSRHVSVQHFYRYKNVFQIQPIPTEAAHAPVIAADHPFILQFRYTSCSDGGINAARRQEVTSRITRILNVVCRPQIFGAPKYVRFFWSSVVPGTAGARWLQEGYGYPGFNPEIPTFSEMPGRRMQLYAADEYYADNFMTRDYEVALPDIVDEYFEKVFHLNQTDAIVFGIASTWFSQIHELWNASSSSAFVAAVCSIEALLDKKTENCKECGQPKYRLTRKFKNFLEKYVPDVRNRFPEELAEIYAVRSQLAHGAKLLLADLQPWSFFGGWMEQKEYSMQSNTHTIVATALRNWVLEH